MTANDEFDLRWTDYTFDEDQKAFAYHTLKNYAQLCPPSRVREASDTGFDVALHRELAKNGYIDVSVAEEHGGQGGTFVEAIIVADAHGRSMAPAPLIESTVVGRLLARLQVGDADTVEGRRLASVISGESIGALLLRPVGEPQVLPAGAVADQIYGLDGDRLVRFERVDLPSPPNHGSMPIAVWDCAQRASVVVAQGEAACVAYRRAVAEWRILTAAALASMTEFALELATEFVKTRETKGVPLGSLQAISHSLATGVIGVAVARNAAKKAAWYAEFEPDTWPELPALAFTIAHDAATDGTARAIHVQGGVGLALESDVTLAFKRAKGWALAGEPRRVAAEIADVLFERRRSEIAESKVAS